LILETVILDNKIKIHIITEKERNMANI
jgi:hypothetical protein